MPFHDHVDHAVLEQILGPLKTVGQFFTDCFFDNPCTGKPDDRSRFRHGYIAEHGEGRRDTARRRIGENNDIG